MKPVLPLFIMIDACGWEIVKNDPFLNPVAPERKKLSSVFGYSSTCVPSILSGRWPVEHRNWCYFVYDPKNSPFHFLRPLRWLPKALTSRRIFRRWLTKFVRWQLGFQGYFDLYNIPFEYISLYDFSEKKSPLKPKGMNYGGNIFDFLEQNKIEYFVSNPDKTEPQNRDDLIAAIKSERVDFSFSYWPGLDGLLHSVGNLSPEIPKRLRMYEQWVDRVLAAARGHYEEVRLYVFSDHGMANCDELLDLKSKIDALDVQMEKDYAVVY
ncbi:MAG: alkaline phosphatase family protein, partial [Verrucomicrobiota bacterium]